MNADLTDRHGSIKKSVSIHCLRANPCPIGTHTKGLSEKRNRRIPMRRHKRHRDAACTVFRIGSKGLSEKRSRRIPMRRYKRHRDAACTVFL